MTTHPACQVCPGIGRHVVPSVAVAQDPAHGVAPLIDEARDQAVNVRIILTRLIFVKAQVTVAHTPVLVVEVLLLGLQLGQRAPDRLLQEMWSLLDSLQHHGIAEDVELLMQLRHTFQPMQAPEQGHQRFGTP